MYIVKGWCKRNDEGIIVFITSGTRQEYKRTNQHLEQGQQAKSKCCVDKLLWGYASGVELTVHMDRGGCQEPNTQREAEEVTILGNLVVSTQKRIDEKKRENWTHLDPKDQWQTEKASSNETRSSGNQESVSRGNRGGKTHQYKHTMSIEDNKLVKKVAQQTLDTPVLLKHSQSLQMLDDI